MTDNKRTTHTTVNDGVVGRTVVAVPRALKRQPAGIVGNRPPPPTGRWSYGAWRRVYRGRGGAETTRRHNTTGSLAVAVMPQHARARAYPTTENAGFFKVLSPSTVSGQRLDDGAGNEFDRRYSVRPSDLRSRTVLLRSWCYLRFDIYLIFLRSRDMFDMMYEWCLLRNDSIFLQYVLDNELENLKKKQNKKKLLTCTRQCFNGLWLETLQQYLYHRTLKYSKGI